MPPHPAGPPPSSYRPDDQRPLRRGAQPPPEPSGGRLGPMLGVILVAVSLLGGWILMDRQSQDQAAQSGPTPPRALVTQLRVTIQPTGKGGLVLSRYIRCPGEQRCRALLALRPEDWKVPAGRVCSQQYGGPTLAWVTGTLRGVEIDEQLNVVDGCQIARWNRLAPALGLPRSGGRSGVG